MSTNKEKIKLISNRRNKPVNCGATVPRVNFENFKEDKMIGLYCSSIGSTELLIRSDAAYASIQQNPKRNYYIFFFYFLKNIYKNQI